MERYPLLEATNNGLHVFGGDQVSAWLEYIKLIDANLANTVTTVQETTP